MGHKRNLAIVFLVSFILLFLETSFFKIIIFTRTFFEATQVIAVAFIGYGIGSMIIFYYPKFIEKKDAILLALLSSVLFSFISAILNNLVLISIFLTSVFAFGSMVLSYYISEYNSNRVYFIDLAGALAGFLAALASSQLMRTENSILSVLALLGFIYFYKNKGFLSGMVFLVFASLLVLNLFHDFGNIASATRCIDKDKIPSKVFCMDEFMPDRNYTRLLSRESLEGRIDIVDEGSILLTSLDGNVVDGISSHEVESYIYDPRNPFIASDKKLLNNPKVLVIGTSAEGIIKPLKSIARPENIEGVEINKEIISIMKDEFYDYSRQSYFGIKTHNDDGRNFLDQTNKKYDLITLMNTYKAANIASASADYLHTNEAFSLYLDHLNEDGFILIEERNINYNSRGSVLRMIYTILHSLGENNASNPKDNLFLYYWENHREKGTIALLFIIVKKSALNENEINFFGEWIKSENEYFASKGMLQSVETLYFPKTELKNKYSDTIKSGNMQGIIYDDRPYLFDAKKIAESSFYLAFLLILIPIGISFSSLYGAAKKSGHKPYATIFFVAALGIAFGLLQLNFIHMLQKINSSYVKSFALAASLMLLSGALGSFYSRNFRNRDYVKYALLLILALSVKIIYPSIFSNYPYAIILIVTAGFISGMLLPRILEITKKFYGKKASILVFGLSLLFNSAGITLALVLSVLYGFSLVYILTIILYFMILILLLMIKND